MKANKPRTATRKKAGSTRQDSEMPSGLQQQIAKRAYEIYEGRIRQGALGQGALDDWLQAEREILQDKTTSWRIRWGRTAVTIPHILSQQSSNPSLRRRLPVHLMQRLVSRSNITQCSSHLIFFSPENWESLADALSADDRPDLIRSSSCDCVDIQKVRQVQRMIPSQDGLSLQKALL